MPYAYGTQNAPAVGNGLGGLPRRSTVATVASTPSGQVLTTSNSLATSSFVYSGVSGSVGGGLGMEFSPGSFCLPMFAYDGTQYNSVMVYATANANGCTYTTNSSIGAGTTSVSGPGTYWKGTNGTSLYWLKNNDLYSVTSSGGLSLVVSSLFSSGTFNSGSFSGSTWTNPSFYSQHFPDNSGVTSGLSAWYVDAGDGTGVGVKPVNMSGTVRIGVFVTNSSGTFTQSFAVGNMSSITIINYYMVVRRIGATTYSVFWVGVASGGGLYAMSLTFDTSNSTGNVVQNFGVVGSAPSGNTSNICTVYSTTSSLQFVFYDGGTGTVMLTFPCSALSTPAAGTITFSGPQVTNVAQYKIYDATYNDYWFQYIQNPVPYLEPTFLTTGPGIQGVVSYSTPTRTIVDLGGSTNTVSFQNVGTVFAAINSDPSPSAWGTPYVFQSFAYRLNQTSWVAIMNDQNASNYRAYLQLFKVA